MKKICFSCSEAAEILLSYGRWHAFYCDGCAGDVIPHIENDGYSVTTTTLDN